MCSRSFIAANDITAVLGLILDGLGAPSLQTMTKINNTDGVLDEEVRTKKKLFSTKSG